MEGFWRKRYPLLIQIHEMGNICRIFRQNHTPRHKYIKSVRMISPCIRARDDSIMVDVVHALYMHALS